MTEQNTFAIAELQQKANDGDAQAQFALALCYAHGTDVVKNTELAFDWHKKAAEHGHVNAQFALGLYYFLAKDRVQQIEKLFKKWVKKWDQGVAFGKNVDPALDLAISQAMAINLNGANDDLAFVWLKKAAEQNHAEANYWLGICYRNGIGTQQNDGLAFDCLKKAAGQGYADAYYWLAYYYRDGKVVRQSDNLAYEWLTKAVENTEVEPEAYLFLGELYADGKGVAQSDELSFHWYEKAAEKEVAEAQYRLAHCYEYGIGVEINIPLANKWYEAAAERDVSDAESQYRLAKYHLYGNGVEKDNSIGMNWLIRAVQANHAEANRWLENTYLKFAFPYFFEREEIDQCHEFSFEWLLNGHEQNPKDFEINFGLAVLYAFGKGVEKNQELAVKHFIACMRECSHIMGREVAENFTEIFYDFSNLYEDISAGTFKSYYFDVLAPFFFEENPIVKDTKKSYAVLPSLRIAFHLEMGEFELLKEFLNSFEDLESSFNYPSSKRNFKDMGLTVNKQAEDIVQKNQELEEKNRALESEIKQKDSANHRMQKLVEQFTHSLGNVIFPDTIYQVAERLKNNPECRKDVLLLHEAYHSEIIIKLQGELLRQRYANTNPEKFRQFIRSCRRTQNHPDKTKSIEDILDYAASRVTARFLNQHYAGLTSIRDKILSKKNVSHNALKQKFEDDILLNTSLRPIAWINQNLRPIQIAEISPLWKKVFILSESHAEALLFGYFSEILFNAFKYADHDKDEFLTLVFDEKTINDKMYLSCCWENPVKDKSPSMLGTGKGLNAIQEDLKQLNNTENPGESLLISQQKNQFQVTLFFKKDLLVNELPSLKIKRQADME